MVLIELDQPLILSTFIKIPRPDNIETGTNQYEAHALKLHTDQSSETDLPILYICTCTKHNQHQFDVLEPGLIYTPC